MFVLYNKNVKCVSKKIGHMFNGKKGKKAQKIRSILLDILHGKEHQMLPLDLRWTMQLGVRKG